MPTTILVRFEASPEINGPHFGHCAGAYISAFVVAGTVKAARDAVSAHATKKGWRIDRWDEAAGVVERQACLDDPELLYVFDSAQALGVAMAVHAYAKRLQDLN
jgi:hypothetical protein